MRYKAGTKLFNTTEARWRRRRAKGFTDTAGERRALPIADVLNVFTNNRKRQKDK